jgi:hypothetical protein
LQLVPLHGPVAHIRLQGRLGLGQQAPVLEQVVAGAFQPFFRLAVAAFHSGVGVVGVLRACVGGGRLVLGFLGRAGERQAQGQAQVTSPEGSIVRVEVVVSRIGKRAR